MRTNSQSGIATNTVTPLPIPLASTAGHPPAPPILPSGKPVSVHGPFSVAKERLLFFPTSCCLAIFFHHSPSVCLFIPMAGEAQQIHGEGTAGRARTKPTMKLSNNL